MRSGENSYTVTNRDNFKLQSPAFGRVLQSCSENMQQNYWGTPMLK